MFGLFGKKSGSSDDLDTNRATEYFRRGNFQEALRRADAILGVGPNVALSWRFKGEVLFSMQRYTEAIPCFDRASELGGPGTEELYFWKALALFNDGQVEAGRKILIDFLASKRGTAKDIAAAEKALQAMKPKA